MLELKNIYKDYYIDKKPLHVLKDVNISFPRQQFVSLLGPSGCGKTTTLNIIGGLDQYTKGDLVIEGRSTKDFNAEDWDAYRNVRIGFVFQTYNLISHLSVRENVEMGMQLAGIKPEDRKKRSAEVLAAVGLSDVLNKDVKKLSGGQMQRVAIARALVNDPDIILADEPTGALDSETSKDVMELLKEISKTKLVIMVTHNEQLANDYSDRVIRMLDGVITSDSAPYEIDYDREEKSSKKPKRTKMSFWTALKSSFKNISTKKGRTIMTSIAASFGIIGVGLVLAISNGFSNYVDRLERSTLSVYPLGVYSSTIALKNQISLKTELEPFPDHDTVIIRDNTQITNQMFEIATNIITDDSIRKLEENFLDTGQAASIIKNYNMQMHLTTVRPKGKTEPEKLLTTELTNNGTVIPMPGGNFHQLFGSKEYMTTYYDVIYGDYPQSMNDVVLVVDRYNQLTYSQLYNLGIVPAIEEGQTVADIDNIPFSDIAGENGKRYKVYTNDEYYHEDGTVDVVDLGMLGDEYTIMDLFKKNKTIQRYRNPTGDERWANWDESSDTGIELKITGVLRMKNSSVYTDLMETGLCYTPELADYIAKENIASKFSENYEKAYIQNIPNVIPDNVKSMLPPGTPKMGLFDVIDALKVHYEDKGEEINALELAMAIIAYGIPTGDGDKTIPVFSFYNVINSGSNNSDLTQNDYVIKMTDYLKNASKYGAMFVHEDENGNKIPFNQVELKDRFFMDIFDEIIPYPSMDANDVELQIPYRDLIYSIYDSIAIFPASSQGKKAIIAGINSYNDEMNKEWHDNGQKGNSPYFITVSDLISNISDSLAILVQVISIVLLIFSSISLITAAVMIGIITSASVIERTKEIGVLRALGARKKDITTLFEAETFIIGVMAGIIGILTVQLISLPLNYILNQQFAFAGLGAISNLKWWHAIALVGVNLLITMFASLVPSRNAAKKEPVEALRSE